MKNIRFDQRGARIWILVLVLVMILLTSIAIGLIQSSNTIQSQKSALFSQPKPLPTWISHLGPAPGQVLLKSEIGFEKDDGTNPFWPVNGSVCAQVDIDKIGMNTLYDLIPNGLLSLNGNQIRSITREKVMFGLSVISGEISFASSSQSTDIINICWSIPLPSGDYLAEINFDPRSNHSLRYQWAFRVIDN